MKKVYEWMLEKFLKSSKAWLAIIGVIVTTLKGWFPSLDEVTLQQILEMIMSLIIGKGVADAGKEYAKVIKENENKT